jgi:hypothetical protein
MADFATIVRNLVLAGVLAGGAVYGVAGPRAAADDPAQRASSGGGGGGSSTPTGRRHASMGRRLLAAALGDSSPGGTLMVLPQPDTAVDAVIATLPDPVDSHGDWAYDSFVEALRRAHESTGYAVERAWLPWSAGADSVVNDSLGLKLRGEYAGVILFRRGDTDASTPQRPRRRLLYLVGEVPTLGVHVRALRHALTERDSLLGKRDTLRLVGPTYSGSAEGLSRVLVAWQDGRADRAVSVVTGSATSATNRHFFQVAGFSFAATVNSDQALGAMVDSTLLKRLGVLPRQVALLVESSPYGQSVEQTGLATDSAHPENPKEKKQEPRVPIIVPFPLNIGSLRTAYEASAAAAAAGHRDAAAPAEPHVPLSLTDPARPAESPPVMSRLTAPTLDVVMDGITRTLRSHDVRMVGIAASDIRDRLFLASELRGRLRDVRFFTFESNTLYLAPEFNHHLRGMLVVSTYPLIPETQLWAAGPGSRHLLSFANEYAEGVYNAALVQLGRRDQVLDFVLPEKGSQTGPPVWITAVGSTGLLPLLVDSARDRYAGLKTEVSGRTASPDPRLDFLTVLVFLIPFVLTGVLAYRTLREHGGFPEESRRDGTILQEQQATGRAVLAERAPAERPGLELDLAGRVDRILLFRRARWAGLRYQRQLYAALQIVALAGAFFPMATVYTMAILWDHKVMGGVLTFLLVVSAGWTLLALGVSIFQAWRWYRLYRDDFDARYSAARERRDLWTLNVHARRLLVALGAVYLVLTLVFTGELLLMALGSRSRFAIFFHRASQVESGLSPLAPLVLAATGFFLWCVWHLRRVESLRSMTAFEAACLTREPGVDLSDVDAGDPVERPSDEERWFSAIPPRAVQGVRQVRARFFRLVPDRRALVLFAVLAAAAVYIWSQSMASLEVLVGIATFDQLYKFVLIALLLVTAWAVYRLVAVWSALQRCLEAVAGTPLVTAFERLPKRIARLTRLNFFGVARSAVVAPVAAVQWRHLHTLGEDVQALPPAKDATPAALAADVELRAEVARFAALPQPVTSLGVCGDEGRLGGNFVELAALLERFWKREPGAAGMEHVRGAAERQGAASTSGQFRRSFSDPLRLWLRGAEEFAAVMVVDYVEWVIAQLRVLALFLFSSLLITIVLLGAYPFQPESLVRLVFVVILLATVAGIMSVVVQMNRDEVLSRIAKTEPGKVTWDWHFVTNALVFGLVPVATLISSEFPEVRDFLFAWVGPLSRLFGAG